MQEDPRPERPERSEAWVYDLFRQGQRRLSSGQPGAAAEVLELAAQEEPAQASIHETLGRAYFASGRVEGAREQFEQALVLDPSDAYAHFGVGRCYERQSRWQEAAKHYKLACALSERVDYQTALGRVLARLGQGRAG